MFVCPVLLPEKEMDVKHSMKRHREAGIFHHELNPHLVQESGKLTQQEDLAGAQLLPQANTAACRWVKCT